MPPFPAALRHAPRLGSAASSRTPLALPATACSAPLAQPELRRSLGTSSRSRSSRWPARSVDRTDNPVDIARRSRPPAARPAHSTRARRLTTMPPLVKQPSDDRSLEQDHSTNRQKLRTILVPYSRFAKINLASGHQATFADAPALHFPPVEFRFCKPGGWYLDVASALAAEDTNGHRGCQAAPLADRVHRAANNLTAKKRVIMRKNGRVGDGIKPFQRFVVFMHDTRRINVHQMPEDRGLRWKRSRVFQYLFKRKLIVPCECNAICEAPRLPADFLQPKFLVGRITVHHCHGLGVGQHPQDVLENCGEAMRERDNRVICGKSGIANAALFHRREDHWGGGKEVLPMALDKGDRGRAHAHDQVERAIGMEGMQILNECSF